MKPECKKITIGYCRDCIWWEGPIYVNNMPGVSDYGRCKAGVGKVDEFPEIDGCIGDGRPEDGSGDGRTGPNFGCVNFKEMP
jgi:hypothetical protein